MKITLSNLENAKKDIEEGKNLREIIDEHKIDANARELNDALIRRYGSENIGNPMFRIRLMRQAKKLMENAKVELTTDQIKEVLDTLKSEL